MSDDRVTTPALPEQEEIKNQVYYRVKIIHSSETEVCTSPLPESLKRGDKVIVPSRYGKDLGIILGETHFIEDTPPEEIIQVLRIADRKSVV